MMLVDSHCHLNFPDFKDDLDGVVTRAREAGVKVMQTICTQMDEFELIHDLANRFDNIYCSVGVHPNNVDKAEIATTQQIVSLCSSPKVIGIGETGLDYYYERSQREKQQQSFRNHIAAGREIGLPIIVHTRDADDDTLEILGDEMHKGAFKGLIHCFTSSQRLAETCVEMGMYISLSGILSFKNAKDIQEAARALPMERLLVETDAPYLAPVPFRGKRNEPSYVVHTNKFLAELKGISEEECARITTDNFFRLFDKAVRPN